MDATLRDEKSMSKYGVSKICADCGMPLATPHSKTSRKLTEFDIKRVPFTWPVVNQGLSIQRSETGAFWLRGTLPKDEELRDSCQVWT